MRRRPRQPATTDTGVPVDLANGPHVPTWAAPEELERLAQLTPDDPEQPDAVWACMLSARRRWSKARHDWLTEQHVPRSERSRLIPRRRPFWDET